MVQQRKSAKGPATRGKAKASPSKKRKITHESQPSKASRSLGADIGGLFLVAFGIFFMACLFQKNTGILGQALIEFFKGLLGWGAYPFPIIVIFAGGMVLLYPDYKLSVGAYFTLTVIFLMVIALFSLLGSPTMSLVLEDYGYNGFIQKSHEFGVQGQASGGALAGMIIFPLLLYFGKNGSIIACFLVLTVLAVIWGFSFKAMSHHISRTVDTVMRERQSRKEFKAKKLYIDDLRHTAPPAKRPELDIIDDSVFVAAQESPEEAAMEEDTLEVLKSEDIEIAPSEEDAPDMNIEIVLPEPQEDVQERMPEPVPVRPHTPVLPPQQLKMEGITATGVQEEPRIYQIPPMTLLEKSKIQTQGDDTAARARKLEDALHSFGIRADVVGINCGPAITQFEVQPAPGVKSSSIVSLSNDLALNLAAPTIRIEAPIPGKSVIGVEVPNTKTSIVKLRDVIETPEFDKSNSSLTFGLGRDIVGRTVLADLGRMPHVLIAGATGSGKSVCINALLISLLYRSSPKDVRLILIDPKVVEMSIYNDIPHLLIPVVTDPQKAAGALKWAVKEMEERYQKFAAQKVRDIARYNEVIEDPTLHMPYIVIVIDEMADLMMVAASDVEDSVCRLAQKARAAGMHLVLATQRPSVDVITGVIKANIPSRIAFAVSPRWIPARFWIWQARKSCWARGTCSISPMAPANLHGCRAPMWGTRKWRPWLTLSARDWMKKILDMTSLFWIKWKTMS